MFFLDPQKKMEEAVRSGQYFSRDRGHANAAGNDLIAQWVLILKKNKAYWGTSNGTRLWTGFIGIQ